MNNSQMPFSLAYASFKLDLVSLINNCNLPPCVIEDILTACIRDISDIAKNQQEKDVETYLKLKAQNQAASECPNESNSLSEMDGDA